ncbi:MAG: metal-binding protein [Candidatus Syntrophoarchaeum sp.]|nr:metal-binding protein [Candidatus Syntrophoarchaeum sp.]
MPGDAEHIAWAQRVAFVAGVVLYASGVDLIHVLGIIGTFLFGTMYVSPDLDIQSKPFQRWGIFRILWYPFLRIVAHRSNWSHNILLGPITVVSYFMLIAIGAGIALNKFWLPVVEPLIDQGQEILRQLMTLHPTHDNFMLVAVFVASLLAAAEWHILLDIMMKGDRQK